MGAVKDLITDPRTADRLKTFMSSLGIEGWLLVASVGKEAVVLSGDMSLATAEDILVRAEGLIKRQNGQS